MLIIAPGPPRPSTCWRMWNLTGKSGPCGGSLRASLSGLEARPRNAQETFLHCGSSPPAQRITKAIVRGDPFFDGIRRFNSLRM